MSLSPAETASPPGPPLADGEFFGQHAQAHDGQLKAYLRASFPGVRDVEDVVQESYLRFWRARPSQPVRSLKALLFTIGRRIALDVIRRQRRSPISAVGDPAALDVIEERPGIRETLAAEERLALLSDAVATLPPRCRDVIILCKIHGLSHREAAARLGISEKTVDEQVLRGVKRLGAELRRRGTDFSRAT